MGGPFLASDDGRRISRSAAIAAEVKQYLSDLTVYQEDLERYKVFGGKVDSPRAPDRPDILEWHERVERWGLPNPGPWPDQPKQFMLDLEAAELGIFDYRHTSEANPIEAAMQGWVSPLTVRSQAA